VLLNKHPVGDTVTVTNYRGKNGRQRNPGRIQRRGV